MSYELPNMVTVKKPDIRKWEMCLEITINPIEYKGLV